MFAVVFKPDLYCEQSLRQALRRLVARVEPGSTSATRHALRQGKLGRKMARWLIMRVFY